MRTIIEVENGFTIYRCARCGSVLQSDDKDRIVFHPAREFIGTFRNSPRPIDCEFAGKRYMKPARLFDVEVK
jgi:hypothetical protein